MAAQLLLSTLLFIIIYTSFSTKNVCMDVDLHIKSTSQKIMVAPHQQPKSIRISGDFPLNLNLHLLQLTFIPNIQRYIDYDIYPMYKYRLPSLYTSKHQKLLPSFQLILLTNQTKWIQNISTISTVRNSRYLRLINAQYCDHTTFLPTQRMKPTTLLYISINAKHIPCPLLILPRVSHSFQNYITNILTKCQQIRIININHLNRIKMQSIHLLELNPPILLIDARNSTTIQYSAQLLDIFLSSHSVLDIIWEPYHIHEPLWFILMPKPIGMPGHLYALIDILQWKHKHVIHALHRFPMGINCTKDKSNCIPGCPETKVIVTWAAGWGADTNRWATELERSIIEHRPLQIGPVRMSHRTSFPEWNNQIGWQYTFNSCNSNFLNCVFLNHSPCPHIVADVWNDPGKIIMNTSRFISHSSSNLKLFWWEKLVGNVEIGLPMESVGELTSSIAQHVLYTYFVRPKYSLRKKVELSVIAFNLTQDTCVFMHIRRGDILLHGDQSSRALAHITCKSPLSSHGVLPQRCLETPYIRIEQSGYTCENGYELLCQKNVNLGGDQNKAIDDPSNMLAANFSKTTKAFRIKTKIEYVIPGMASMYSTSDMLGSVSTIDRLKKHADMMVKYLCQKVNDRAIPMYC